jgi:hypothetical protein
LGVIRKPQINTTVPDHIRNEIEKRGKGLGITKAQYLASIAAWWYGQGSPPISEEEKRLISEKPSARRAS